MMMVKKFNLIILVWYSIISAGSEIPRCIDMTSMENLERVPTRKSRRENLKLLSPKWSLQIWQFQWG